MSAANAKPFGETGDGAEILKPLERAYALVPAVQRVHEVRVRRGFWPRMRKLAGHVPFAADAVALYYCATDPETPAAPKALVIAALVYFISPFSIVQDLMAGIGFVSDAAVIAAVIAIIGRHLKPHHREQGRDWLRRFSEG